jgi:hypothetical protein
MATWEDAAKEEALDAVTADLVQLHDGDPGANGDANTVSTKVACSFGAASGGVRALSGDVNYTGLTPDDQVQFITFWEDSSPDVLKVVLSRAAGDITGDLAVNSEGEFTIKSDTALRLNDPS